MLQTRWFRTGYTFKFTERGLSALIIKVVVVSDFQDQVVQQCEEG